MEWRRKAQAGAAVLIVLIALLIILYILFLPPAERAALLGEGTDTPPTPPEGRENVVFSTVPAIVDQRDATERTALAPFTVRTVTSADVLAQRSGLQVERSVFHTDAESVSFTVPDAAENLLLSFSVLQAAGSLQIDLNGERVFDSPVLRGQPAPITLSRSLLTDGVNELRFSVSGVGFRIWETNRYELSNILVTADVTSFAEADQTQRFVVTDLDRVERARLRFIPECFDRPGRLLVSLNDQTVFSGRPECGVPIVQDLALARLSEGENTLSWSVTEGRYIIDDVEILIERSVPEAQERFTIAPELYNRVLAQHDDFLLRLSFRQAGSEGVVVVNGQELAFRTHRQSFAAPITRYLRPGTNTIEVAESTAQVILLEVLYG